MFPFTQRKPAVEIQPFVRRICDLTTPNLPTGESLGRIANRSNRTIPTLMCPWENGRPVLEESTICLTSDLSDQGARIVLTQPINADQVVLGYWMAESGMTEPWFLLAEVRRCQAAGGGYWNLGVEWTGLAHDRYRDRVAPLKNSAAQLLPPVAKATT